MKRVMATRGILALFIAAMAFTSCQKQELSTDNALLSESISQAKGEKAARAFKARTKTRYRFAPLFVPVPITINGVDYIGTAHVPGDGVGNATHMGRVTTYFNQLSYIPAGADPRTTPPAGSLPAPITEVPGYPFFLPPPPPGEPIDFTRLSGLISSLPIPTEVGGMAVNSMFVNDKNEAVFGAYLPEGAFVRPESPTRIVFGGKARFVGGTGKFAGATGEFDFLGYFNPQNQDDAEFTADGWIKY